LYAKGSVVWSSYGVFEVRAHEFLRSVCICYFTLRYYYIRWWYWSKKRFWIKELIICLLLKKLQLLFLRMEYIMQWMIEI